MLKNIENIELETPIEYELKDYHEPLQYGNNDSGIVTHEALVSHSAYTLAKMWQDGFKWSENMWCHILGVTDKALLVAVCARMYWIPKRLIKKVRKIREVKKLD